MKRLILYLVLCLTLSGCGESYYIKQANHYYNQGDYEKAIENFDKALIRNPENYDVYIDKGLAFLELGDNKNAIKTFTEAISISPKEAYAYDCRAESYMRLEKYQEALDDYNDALGLLIGHEGDVLRFWGSVHNDFFSIVEVDPYKVYADRAVACYFLGNIELAWKDLNLCIGKGKELAQCYYWRGLIYLERGHKKEACEDLLKSAQLGESLAEELYREYCN